MKRTFLIQVHCYPFLASESVEIETASDGASPTIIELGDVLHQVAQAIRVLTDKPIPRQPVKGELIDL